jgi:hypothetical protein
LIISFCCCIQFAFSQDIIIDRKSRASLSDSLTITRFTDDSIFYKTRNQVKSISFKNVIAFKAVSRGKTKFDFPDKRDEEEFILMHSKAFYKSGSGTVYLKEYLTAFPTNSSVTDDSLKGYNPIFFTHKKKDKTLSLNKKRKIYLVLKGDAFGNAMSSKVYQFRDSLIYFKFKIKKETNYYVFRLNQIKYMGVQTPLTLTARCFLGTLEIPLALAYPFLFINPFAPIYKKLNLVNDWNVDVAVD